MLKELVEKKELACKKYRVENCVKCPYCINITGTEVKSPENVLYRTCAIDRVIHVERWM